ncbi:MAG: hypothetical protein JWP48_5903 [Actinoallomurus sp.]|jgi:hypothetical protein|nr:hypothetical protein [Actinoallomurus sp.]
MVSARRQKSESELAARAEFDRKHPDRVQPGSLSREEARRLLDAAVAARTDGSST